MVLSLEWLREFTDVDVSDKEYCDAMTLSDDQATFGIYHGALYPGASNINTKNHHAQHSP